MKTLDYLPPLAILGALLLTTAASAQTIAGVTIQDVSSELTGGNFSRLAVHTINGNGFEPNGAGTHAVLPDGTMWLNNGPSNPLPAVITFDLEGNYDLNSFTVWNYNEATSGLTTRGANNVEILVSDREGGVFTSLGEFTFTQAPGDNTTAFGQVIDLSSFPAADSTRLIRFNITSNYGGLDNYTGLSEVRFDGASVPAPLIITALSPDEESAVPLGADLVATFNKDIALKPGGTITLTNMDDSTGTVVIPLPNAQVSVSGAELTINPSSDLEIANYEVTIDGSAIESTDVSPEAFVGTFSAQWTFSTYSLVEGLAVQEVAGDGVIGDEVLATDGGVATLATQIGTNWRTGGGNGGGAPQAFSSLTSPTLVVPTTGPVTLSFKHRYNFELGYDGGAVFISVNGAEATYLAPGAFTQNGYVGVVANTVWAGGEEVFHGKSSGFDQPTLIRSVADLGSLNANDTISVEFRGGWDANTYPAGPNWEIGEVMIEDSVNTALLDVNFTTDSTSGFTALTTAVNPSFPGGWEYTNVQHTFEIDADTPATADRYAPDPAGSVIDLNGAEIVVELQTGTLDAGDEFTLFDLSGGTTLTGSIGSLTLPPGLWDSSTLAVDGRIILLLPPVGGLTAGADFEVDARVDTDGDDIWEELIGTSGYEFYLDTAGGVSRMTTTSTTQLTHTYDFPGDLPGTGEGSAGGAKLVLVGETGLGAECRSFNEVGYHGNDATLEFWIKPDNLTPVAANGQVIWEDGGGSGFGLFVGGGLIYTSQDGGPPDTYIAYDVSTDPSGLLIAPATTEFIQVVLTRVGSTGATEMFINGQSVGTATDSGGGWSGGDGTALGGRGEANVGGQGGGDDGTSSFDGQIALFRIYNQQILSPLEVESNFLATSLPDTTPPTYTSLFPANLTTGFFAEFDLVATFSEEISLTGAGSLTLRNLDLPSDTVILLPDPQVSVSGNQLTINPTGPLAYDANYAVLISSDAIEDLASTPNAFAGISDPTRWTFKTDPQDLDSPMITSLSPTDDGTGVMALDSLVVTFDETVLIATGDITLKNLTEGTESTIAITDGTQVSLADNVLTITPTSSLMSETDYAVRIAAGAITDISGNTFNGIPDNTTWNFTTANFPEVLFADSFDRPDSTDLNASPAGKSGLLGALNWGSGSLASLIDINNNAMRINNNSTPGNDGSWAWVEHNFSGLSELTITLDITAQNSGGDGRLAGFRMGQTLADISGEADAATVGNAADVQVYLDNIGATKGIKVFEGTTDLGYVVNSISGVGVLSATFTFDDMDAGTALNYEIFLNGVSQYSGSTTWSGTDENFISVQSNSTDDTRFDSFIVTGRPYTGGADYVAWSGGFPGAELSDPKGDFDGDGLTNDYERLFGLDPTSNVSIDPIAVPLNASAGTFSFTRRDRMLTGLFTDIETSFDLVTWTVDSGAILTAGTPDGNGVQMVDVQLSPGLLASDKLFVRVNQNKDGTLFVEDFEGGDGGYTTAGTPNDWEWGTPNSNNSLGLVITTGNGGSANCWATKRGAGEGPPAGLITAAADSILRSPDIDLTGVAGVELGFAAAVDANSGDVVEVLVRDAGTDALLATILPLGVSPLTAIQTSDWMSYGPFDLSVVAGSMIYLEFRYLGQDASFIGLYIDDVTVTELIPSP